MELERLVVPGRNGSGASARPSADDGDVVLQFRVWLKDLSPMVWRRVSVVSTTTLRELHGVLQVAMGWEGIHLYQFVIRTVRYGSWETGARSANTTGVIERSDPATARTEDSQTLASASHEPLSGRRRVSRTIEVDGPPAALPAVPSRRPPPKACPTAGTAI